MQFVWIWSIQHSQCNLYLLEILWTSCCFDFSWLTLHVVDYFSFKPRCLQMISFFECSVSDTTDFVEFESFLTSVDYRKWKMLKRQEWDTYCNRRRLYQLKLQKREHQSIHRLPKAMFCNSSFFNLIIKLGPQNFWLKIKKSGFFYYVVKKFLIFSK